MPLFTGIELHGWRQFGKVSLDFGQQTTVLTGTNGSGKTTILNTLGYHFGWTLNFVSTPFIGKRRAKRLWSDIYVGEETEEDDALEDDLPDGVVSVGHVGYDNGGKCSLLTNRYVSANYQLQYSGVQTVPGLFIPSHRPVATYHAVENIPTNPVTIQQHYQQYQQLLLRAFNAAPRQNPGLVQKQSIIALALFGEGNSSVLQNPLFKGVFEGFQATLRIVLPKELGFQRIEVRMPEVVLCTSKGDFSLDAMSGGINSIFGIVWQIFMFGHSLDGYVVLMDEPENHLHPSMQRILLPNLAKAFPNTRFIVATHSPFIVSSFQDAVVYGLMNNPEGRIESKRLDQTELAGTPNQILREVLDVDSNLPIWVEEQVRTIIAEMENLPVAQRADHILHKLSDMGISDALMEFGAKKK